MNCDYVFDILTRGPFPSGRPDDAAVERHLAVCHGCRELAEALRPAVALLHEAVGEDEGNSLPGYRGALCEEPPQLDLWASVAVAAESTGERSVKAQSSQSGSKPWRGGRTIVSYLAAALAGVLLAAVVGFAGWPWHREATPPLASGGGSAAVMAARYQPDAEGLRMLVALNLPEVCFPHAAFRDGTGNAQAASTSGASTAVESQGILCCTECHYARSAHRPPPEAVARVQQQCRACHQP